MLGAAYQPQFLSVFDPLIATVVDALRRSVFEQWIGLTMAGLGFLIIWRARKSSLSGTAAAIGWAMFVMMVATVLFRWPLAAGQAADTTVVSTMSGVTAALDERDATGHSSTGQLAASNLHDALLYQVWLGGEFGDSNSVAARKYGAQLFDAQALTWAQAATLAQDPAAGQQIINAKEAKFKQIAAQVQAEDPDAYEYLRGRRTDARVGFAALSMFAVACAVPFLLMASLLVIGALVITRFAVMLFPAVATLGLFPAMRTLVIGVGNTVAAAVINALVFGVGTAVMVKAFGVVMAPGNGLPSWLVVALLLLLTLVMWFSLSPFRRLTAMASPGGSHFGTAAGALGSVTRGIGRAGGRLVGTAAAVILADGVTHDRTKTEPSEEDKKAVEKKAARRAEADGETGADDSDGAGISHGPAAGSADGRSSRGGAPPRRRLFGAAPIRPGPDSLVETAGTAPSGQSPAGRSPAGRSLSGQSRSGDSLAAAEVAPRTNRPGPHRSEAADLEEPKDQLRWSRAGDPPGAGAGPDPGAADLDGEEVFSVYRPEDPAGGNVRV
jgi:hypothetical protein